MSRYWSKSAFFKGVDHFKRKIQEEGDIVHRPLLVSENYSDCPFIWYQNIGSMFFLLITKHACDGNTDGRTDRQNYDH